MKSYPLVRVPSQELSLWQSVVSSFVLEQLQSDSENQKNYLTAASAQQHPMMVGVNEHVSKVFKPGDPMEFKMSSEPKTVDNTYLSELCFNIGRAQARENEELEKSLMIQYRKFSDKDPGFASCAKTYAEYYIKYKGVLKYNSWEDHGGMNYGVMDYKIPDKAKVAIIGDWGTGMEDAVYLLRVLMDNHKPDVIIHLGDIYYSGTPDECADNFSKIFDMVFKEYGRRIPVFTIPGNHDYYAFGYGYYEMVKALNKDFSGAEQDSSFFCLRTEDEGWQFLGMDTGYDDSNPANQLNPVYAGPRLQTSEIAWHKDKLKNFAGSTILLSHHQLCSGNARINGRESVYGSYPYLNKYLLDVFRPYLGSKVAAWIWGHEHNQVIFNDRLFGLPSGRLVGASAFEELVAEDPYKLNYPEAPFSTKYKLGHENGYYNHSYAIIDLSQRTTPSGAVKISYFEYPSWGAPSPTPSPIPKTSKHMLTEVIETKPPQQKKPIGFGQKIIINLEQGNAFFGPAKIGAEYYPTIKQKPVPLKLLGGEGNSGSIMDGDIVQIQSLEPSLKKYNVLGAWKIPSLYYYTPGYDQQNWYIRKVTNKEDAVIYEGDGVQFVNTSYAGQFLAPLIQIKNPGTTYLTSDAKVPAVWYLKMV